MSFVQTTKALDGDTLDAVAHRIYGSASSAILAQMIELNEAYNPFAILPYAAVINLPNRTAQTIKPTIKLWD